MYVIAEMRRINLIIIGLFIVFATKAQQNDTAVIRKNNVATVEKHQFIHAFEDNQDTCLLEYKEFNTRSQLAFHRIDMHCMGWNNTEERAYAYTDEGLVRVEIRRDNLLFAKTRYTYNGTTDPAQISTYYAMENDSVTSNNTYFRSRKNQLDSTLAYRTKSDGSTESIRTIYRYDKHHHLVQQVTSNQLGELLDMVSYETSKEGKINSVAYTTYGENPSFKQVYYSYDQNGRIASTVDTQNRKQLYFYAPNGLLFNVLTYNGNGILEVEFLFKYTYHE